MKNLLALILIGIIIMSFPACNKQSVNKNNEEKALKLTMIYLQDPVTKLCFGATTIGNVSTFDTQTLTCVPCDSLKFVKIYRMKSYLMDIDKFEQNMKYPK